MNEGRVLMDATQRDVSHPVTCHILHVTPHFTEMKRLSLYVLNPHECTLQLIYALNYLLISALSPPLQGLLALTVTTNRLV